MIMQTYNLSLMWNFTTANQDESSVCYVFVNKQTEQHYPMNWCPVAELLHKYKPGTVTQATLQPNNIK